MDNKELVQQLLSDETLFLVIGGTVAVVAILAGSIGGVIKSLGRERTRREIAAYIAEGSMTPEQGERLMAANPDHPKG